MQNWYTKSVEELCEAILTLKTKEECCAFLEDICTIKEIQDMSQRLEVAIMLRKGLNYQDISAQTGVSTATISRVSKCLNYGSGGYNTAIDKLEKAGK